MAALLLDPGSDCRGRASERAPRRPVSSVPQARDGPVGTALVRVPSMGLDPEPHDASAEPDGPHADPGERDERGAPGGAPEAQETAGPASREAPDRFPRPLR